MSHLNRRFFRDFGGDDAILIDGARSALAKLAGSRR